MHSWQQRITNAYCGVGQTVEKPDISLKKLLSEKNVNLKIAKRALYQSVVPHLKKRKSKAKFGTRVDGDFRLAVRRPKPRKICEDS